MHVSFKMRLLILGYVLIQCYGDENRNCEETVVNVRRVPRCPANETEWDTAAQNKNCEAVIKENRKNCSDPEEFQYHCLINSYEDATIDMCTPKKIIIGFCAEYNDVGRLIQEHEGSPCNTTGFPACKQYHHSEKAFLYQGCYELVTKRSTDTPEEGSPTLLIATITPIIIVILLIIIILIVLHRYKNVFNCKSKNDNNMELDERQRFISPPQRTDQQSEVTVIKGSEAATPTDKEESKVAVPVYNEAEIGTATDKCVLAVIKSRYDLSEENKEESRRFLNSYKTIDRYFVETETYEKGKETFKKYGIVIWKGHSGCGKTIAAIHLIINQMTNEPDWTFRKIRSWQELSYIKMDEKTLVFIDNIFFRKTMNLDLENWWKVLDEIHESFLQTNTEGSGLSRLRFVITAQTNATEQACSFMGKTTPVLYENYQIDATSLKDMEKEKIFFRQIDFAKNERHVEIPTFDTGFLEKVKASDGPIGFPLCAHLFVCSDEYQKSGVHFFSRPIKYLKFQIKDEIESEKRNRTKSLFFLLFFIEWQTKSGNPEKIEINCDDNCRSFLKRISKDLLKKFKPFDFRDLEQEARRLVGTFLKEDDKNVFAFVHDSVYEAVGDLLCETYPIETAKYFPLDVIQDQGFEKANEKQLAVLATRTLYEILHQRLSLVFSCKPFKRKAFVDIFWSELIKKDKKTIKKILTIVNDSSQIKLPSVFWASRNRLTYLTEKFFEIVSENDVQPDYQLYASLYGDCCAKKESLMKTLNGVLQDNLKGLKQHVLDFTDDDTNNIIHLVITSEKSDEFASVVVEKLLKEKASFVDARNKANMTPLMLAVNQSMKRRGVLAKLIKEKPKLYYKDAEGLYVFHHCLASSNDDETCAVYLKMILTLKDSEKYLHKDDTNGNTVLCTAAMQAKNSRICSILMLLDHGKSGMLNTMNGKGFSPLQLSVSSLTGGSAHVKLECCVRVILLLLCGDNPDNKSDTNESAIEVCKYDVVKKILRNPEDKPGMIHALDCILNNFEDCKDVINFTEFPPFPGELNKELQNRIKLAVQILKNKTFD